MKKKIKDPLARIMFLDLNKISAMALLGNLQLALRHPDNNGPTSKIAMYYARKIQEGLTYEDHTLEPIINMGWEGNVHTKKEARPKIVCLCGSGRFMNEFNEAEEKETLAGNIVLTIGCNTRDVARDTEYEKYKPLLDELHLKKIDLADEVFIINVGGYIGESTFRELKYAIANDKQVRYLIPIVS